MHGLGQARHLLVRCGTATALVGVASIGPGIPRDNQGVWQGVRLQMQEAWLIGVLFFSPLPPYIGKLLLFPT